MNIIAELPISTQISLFALFISVISLIHSVKNSSSKAALIKAEKKLQSILNWLKPS